MCIRDRYSNYKTLRKIQTLSVKVLKLKKKISHNNLLRGIKIVQKVIHTNLQKFGNVKSKFGISDLNKTFCHRRDSNWNVLYLSQAKSSAL